MELQMLNLRAEAIAEARRLAAARTYACRRGQRAPRSYRPGVLVARARHRDTRQRLAGRLLLIFRLSCVDALGRLEATRVVAVLCAVDSSAIATLRRPSDGVRAAIRAAAMAAETHVQRVSAEWIEDTARVVEAFREARQRREHERAERIRSAAPRPFQAGLFDRRAERARLAERARAADGEDEQQVRLRMLEHSAALESTVELMLVLTP